MMKQRFTQKSELVVRNSVVVLVITAIVFMLMLVSIFKYNTSLGDTGYIIVGALAPIVFYFIFTRTKKAIIRINNRGVFYHEHLITSWPNFVSAKTDQLPLGLGDPRDRVVLIIEYYNESKTQILTQQLRLHNTLNKSEEQMLAIMEYFSGKKLME